MILKNKLATHKTQKEKNDAFVTAVLNNEYAVRSDLTKVPLKQLHMSQVEFIGGLWRIQNDFPYDIQMVRDKEFVLLEKLPHQEKNLFEFFKVSSVGCNCYGYYLCNPKGDFIVAKYKTNAQTYWSYGKTIEQARAFMGIKLYDEYMHLIHSVACKQNNK